MHVRMYVCMCAPSQVFELMKRAMVYDGEVRGWEALASIEVLKGHATILCLRGHAY